ncbi:MAG: hypothetical protein KDI48_04745 [Xanthomonadales bacterium]|nr:hypothetical protein [Xanthomonadales bacterium]
MPDRRSALPARPGIPVSAARLLLLSLCFALPTAQAARPKPAAPTTAEARMQAWEQHQQMERQSPYRGLTWRSIGPVIQGGRVVDIESVPGEPYTFYMAYATGGVWKTTNNGGSFEPLTDRLPSTVTGDIAVDPSNPQTLWVGSGEPNAARSNYGGHGLWVSHDGGASFSHKGLADSDRIARILADPRDGQRVLVAAAGKLYSPGGSRGIYLTEDGGDSWTQVLAGANAWTGASDLVRHPDNPDIVYAALWDRRRTPWHFTESGPGSSIWKSTDGGRSWAQLEGFPSGPGIGRIGLDIARSQPDTVYASIDLWQDLPEDLQKAGDRALSPRQLRSMSKDEFLRQDPDEIEAFIRGSDLPVEVDAKKLLAMVREDQLSLEQLRQRLSDANSALFDADIWGLTVWRSDDAGGQWRRTHAEPLRDVVYTFGYYFGQIRVDPGNAERIYAVGVPLIVSDDGGANWSGYANDPSVHVDHHALWIDPIDPRRIILGNDGGADLSHDGGRTWRKLDAQPVGQFYTIHADMAEPYNVYGGLQDNGTLKGSSRTRWELGEQWSVIGGGDGMYVAVDNDNKRTFTGYQFGNYMRRDSDGSRSEIRPRSPLQEAPLRYNWNSPLVLSPHNPQIVYFGTNRLYRSLDSGDHFLPISPDLSVSTQRGNVPFATITTVSESPLQFGLLAVGTDDGRVHVSRDGGQRWQAVDSRLPADRWVSRVELSHHELERLYLSLNGYRQDDDRPYLYVSDDLGHSWRSIAKGLPTEAINVIREDPVNPEVLYVGTDRGVYVSTDRGQHWATLDGNLPNVPVHDLFVHPRDRELIAGTHGRSAWVVDVLPIEELDQDVRASAVHLFHLDELQADRGWRSEGGGWFDRDAYLPQLTGNYWAREAGPVQLSLVDANEQVVAVFERQAQAGLNSFEWDLLLDRDRVLAAEAVALDKVDEDQREQLEHHRYAESVRLGHRLYPLPGDYQLRIESADQSHQVALKIKAPKAWEPRWEPPYKRRGEKGGWSRNQPEPAAHPRAASRARAWTLPGK